jgi:hypothetical protein
LKYITLNKCALKLNINTFTFPYFFQSFFNEGASSIFKSLCLGQKFQTTHQIPIPSRFTGLEYSYIHRSFNARHILLIAIYRANTKDNNAVLPFVYISPAPDTIMNENDKLFEHRFSSLGYAAGITIGYFQSLIFEHIGDVSAYSINDNERPWDNNKK